MNGFGSAIAAATGQRLVWGLIAVLMLLAAACGLTGYLVYDYMDNARTADVAKVQGTLDKLLLDQANAALDDTRQVRAAEHESVSDMARAMVDLKKVINDGQQRQKKFEGDLRSGAIRVFVPVVPARTAAGSPGAADATGAAAAGEARAELAPAFASALDGITADGDAYIEELNFCIDRYNAERQRAAELERRRAAGGTGR